MRIFTKKQPRSSPTGGLYAWLGHPGVRWLSFLLVLCMVGVQPVHHVLADTVTSSDASDPNVAVPVDVENERVDETSAFDEEEVNQAASTTEQEFTADDTVETEVSPLTSDEPPLELDEQTTVSTSTEDDGEPTIATSTDDVSTTTTATTSSDVAGAATSSAVSMDDPLAEDIHIDNHSSSYEMATGTTSTVSEGQVEVSEVTQSSADSVTSVVSAQNRHQFSERECVHVGDGAYYCQRIPDASGAGSGEDIVFSRLTSSGYRDIFLRTTQGTKNITDSLLDDAGPHYDPVSQTVVWHRDIAGRHQIFSYDIQTKEVVQITDTRANNMEPVRSGDVLVWQRWVDDRWQVMLLEEGAEEQQLTADSVHNLAPYVRGDHVIWNTYTVLGEPRVAVFDTKTQHIMYIGDAEDGRVSNPRFVLVYDTLLPSGDRVTQEFDPTTGKSRPISGVPTAPLPDIPSPDPVGEARALQNKNQEDESGDILNDNDEEDDELDDVAPGSVIVSSSTEPLADVDMRQATTGASTTLSEYDLVVTELSTTSASQATTTEQ